MHVVNVSSSQALPVFVFLWVAFVVTFSAAWLVPRRYGPMVMKVSGLVFVPALLFSLSVVL